MQINHTVVAAVKLYDVYKLQMPDNLAKADTQYRLQHRTHVQQIYFSFIYRNIHQYNITQTQQIHAVWFH